MAAIDGCRTKRNFIGPPGRAIRLRQIRGKVSGETPCHSKPAMASTMAKVMTRVARRPNSCGVALDITLPPPASRCMSCSDHAAETDMTHARVDRLRVSCGGAVPTAVVRRAEV
jgi:hypothetical protein